MPTPKANSRRKGAAFERDVAKMLFQELGITFKRDLRQTQQAGLGDLVADNPAFPFLIECKAYASGTECRPAWEAQAEKAAQIAGLHACVVYKFNNRPVRFRIGLDAIAEAHGTSGTHLKADLCVQGFAYVARELMARQSQVKQWENEG